LLEKHLTPRCRLDASQLLAPIVHAMIDISDGLASEVNHVCRQSGVGAEGFAKDIPLHPDVIDAGRTLGIPPSEFALNGLEDLELLFTISSKDLYKLKRAGISYYQVGRITDRREAAFLVTGCGDKIPLKGGYNHVR